MGYPTDESVSTSKPHRTGKLYFPWLYWGRGYIIPSEPDYERLQRQLRTYSRFRSY